MRTWTGASFNAAAEFDHDLSDHVVWLTSRTERDDIETGSKRLGAALGRCTAKLGRMTAIVGAGCVVTGMVSGSALAPVSPAMASIEHAVEPIQPFSVDVAPAPAIKVAGVSVPTLEEEAIEADRRSVEEFLRFGSRDLPRSLVETIVKAARATGVDPIYLMALADKESSFRTDVKASTSSAQGLFQFIDRTWLDMVRSFGAKHGLEVQAAAITNVDDRPVVADDAVRGAILDLRRDPYVAAVMAAEMLKRDAGLIGFRIGRSLNPTEMYLAHFLGLEDAARFIEMRHAKRPASATKAFPAAARANAAIFFEKKRRGRRGLSVPEVYARIDQMIDTRLSRYQSVVRYASADSHV
jgi:hypothetical protein